MCINSYYILDSVNTFVIYQSVSGRKYVVHIFLPSFSFSLPPSCMLPLPLLPFYLSLLTTCMLSPSFSRSCALHSPDQSLTFLPFSSPFTFSATFHCLSNTAKMACILMPSIYLSTWVRVCVCV